MVKGDRFDVKIYEIARAGGTVRVLAKIPMLGVQSRPLWLPGLPLGVGWDITIQRISASSRAFDWSIRRVY